MTPACASGTGPSEWRVRLDRAEVLRLPRTLEGADEVVCFVATIGPALEDEVTRLGSEGQWAEACVLDAVGSVAAEALAEAVYRDLGSELAPPGLGITPRFSPGHCDWSVRGQFDLFGVLGPRPVGVRLLDSGFMVPRESVSAVFGVLAPGPAGRGGGPVNPCAGCSLEHCAMRREDGWRRWAGGVRRGGPGAPEAPLVPGISS